MLHALRLALDGGWSDGDPGTGRLRLDSPKPLKAKHVYVNGRDSDDALLDELVPTWRTGDELVVEQGEALLHAWIIGPVTHRGGYYRVPVIVKIADGVLQVDRELTLYHRSDRPAEDLQPQQQVQTVVAAPSAVAAAQPLMPEPVAHDDIAQIRDENAALHEVIRALLNDQTEIYAVEGKQ